MFGIAVLPEDISNAVSVEIVYYFTKYKLKRGNHKITIPVYNYRTSRVNILTGLIIPADFIEEHSTICEVSVIIIEHITIPVIIIVCVTILNIDGIIMAFDKTLDLISSLRFIFRSFIESSITVSTATCHIGSPKPYICNLRRYLQSHSGFE